MNAPRDSESMKVDLKAQQGSGAARVAGRRTQSAIAAVALLDEDGCIVDITAEAAGMLGYEPDDLHGRALTELAAPGWKTLAEGVIVRLRSGVTDAFALMLCGRSGRRTLLEMRARKVDATAGTSGTHVLVWSQQAPLTNGGNGACRNDEALRRLAYGLLTNHEEEKSRVAAELHDGVVPLVFIAKLMIEDGLQRLKNGSGSQGTEALVKALDRLRDVSNEVRRISMELHPRMLDDLGLLPTIEWYCRNFSEACSAMQLERMLTAEEVLIVGPLKLEIFRILQEALDNVARHSGARRVRIELVRDGTDLRLSIADDGVGFDAANVVFGNECRDGVGLQSIRKRICATGGHLILESKSGVGTTIGAVWPLNAGVSPASAPPAQKLTRVAS
jgi:two-component system NarL family sensor kinase